MSKEIIYLKDYQKPKYQITNVDLIFELELSSTIVRSTLQIQAQPETSAGTSLLLDGEELELLELQLNGEELPSSAYTLLEDGLLIKDPPLAFTLIITNRINPSANTCLRGLFISNEIFCTQCEPHGFRRMTYFIDRPDNLAHFSTTIIANKTKYPVMLSNGNCVANGITEDGRYWMKWEDPFLKPSYLFALVAGNLDLLEDHFVTQSGRKVALKLYVEIGELDKTAYAMQSLKQAMHWDEKIYGREYDLDIFMIVAVRDFNMGAMENKGLNIFNSKYILANPETATDSDYENILGVVGHEYFHNWSGNRVTCRDWFQLSLKEGLTVFRDQTFTADQTSAAIKRIDDVNILRSHQFSEDSGPMSHPVQPKSYIEIDNFYTLTIYNKGAELIRMQSILLGKEKFRQAMDLYFRRYDGKAVTIEDFVQTMEDASNISLTQFKQWYHQAGTPELTLTDHYDEKQKQYSLSIKQCISTMDGQVEKTPLYIPLAIGLLNQQGQEILATQILAITNTEQKFVFNDIEQQPIISLLRDFSAPIKIHYDYTNIELALLLAHDTDNFSRWQVGQQLALEQINKLTKAYQNTDPLVVDQYYIEALRQVMLAEFEDPALRALLLILPSEKYIIESTTMADVSAIHAAREYLRKSIATELLMELKNLYQSNIIQGDYQNSSINNAKRRVKNVCLSYLSLIDNGEQAWVQYQQANNMTDRLTALTALASLNVSYRQQALQDFYQKWRKDALVLDKWFAVQATADFPGVLEAIKTLLDNKSFNIKNPNNARALIGTFINVNLVWFHAGDGSGYKFLTQQILQVDQFNPQLAAALVTPLLHWHKFSLDRQNLMKQQLKKIIATDKLSKNTYEMVSKALKI